MNNISEIIDNKGSLTFVRQFRYSIKFDDMLEQLAKKTKINFVEKTIQISIIEAIFEKHKVQTDYLDEWVYRLQDSSRIVLSNFDGIGNTLYEYIFWNLKLLSDELNFDISSSEGGVRVLKFSFDKYIKDYFYQKN